MFTICLGPAMYFFAFIHNAKITKQTFLSPLLYRGGNSVAAVSSRARS